VQIAESTNLAALSAALPTRGNAIINGAFDIWQRGTSFSNPGVFSYTADRWQAIVNGSPTFSVSRQSFTPGAAPVAGYESSFFLRQNVTGVSSSTVIAVAQRIEDVRTLAGQTVTLSFWAKADSARTWSANLIQNFGSGGSAEVTTVASSSISVTTSWQRFTVTVALPSISGKTIGAGSFLYVVLYGASNTVQTMDIWGVQIQAGNVATPFARAAGTLQGELAACQRYYEKSFDTNTAPVNSANATSFASISGLSGLATINTGFAGTIPFRVEKRATPTITLFGNNSGHWAYSVVNATYTYNAVAFTVSSIGTSGFTGCQQVVNNVVVTSIGHWVADAEL
jgi:hypothetical protein